MTIRSTLLRVGTGASALALGLALFAVPVQARRHAPPTPSPTPIPPANPAVTHLARRQFVLWQAGRVDRSEYTVALNAQIDDAKIQQTSAGLGSLGALVGMQYLGPVSIAGAPAGVTAYLYKMLCNNGSIYEQMVLDPTGKITGLAFRDTLAAPTP